MTSEKPNNKSQLHPQQNNQSSGNISQQAHFAQAEKIVAAWPEWKRNVCLAATSSDINSDSSPDKK
jgi:hypothetical protein